MARLELQSIQSPAATVALALLEFAPLPPAAVEALLDAAPSGETHVARLARQRSTPQLLDRLAALSPAISAELGKPATLRHVLRGRRDAPQALRLLERFGPVATDGALRTSLLAPRDDDPDATLWADLCQGGADAEGEAARDVVVRLAADDEPLRTAALLALLCPRLPRYVVVSGLPDEDLELEGVYVRSSIPAPGTLRSWTHVADGKNALYASPDAGSGGSWGLSNADDAWGYKVACAAESPDAIGKDERWERVSKSTQRAEDDAPPPPPIAVTRVAVDDGAAATICDLLAQNDGVLDEGVAAKLLDTGRAAPRPKQWAVWGVRLLEGAPDGDAPPLDDPKRAVIRHCLQALLKHVSEAVVPPLLRVDREAAVARFESAIAGLVRGTDLAKPPFDSALRELLPPQSPLRRRLGAADPATEDRRHAVFERWTRALWDEGDARFGALKTLYARVGGRPSLWGGCGPDECEDVRRSRPAAACFCCGKPARHHAAGRCADGGRASFQKYEGALAHRPAPKAAARPRRRLEAGDVGLSRWRTLCAVARHFDAARKSDDERVRVVNLLATQVLPHALRKLQGHTDAFQGHFARLEDDRDAAAATRAVEASARAVQAAASDVEATVRRVESAALVADEDSMRRAAPALEARARAMETLEKREAFFDRYPRAVAALAARARDASAVLAFLGEDAAATEDGEWLAAAAAPPPASRARAEAIEAALVAKVALLELALVARNRSEPPVPPAELPPAPATPFLPGQRLRFEAVPGGDERKPAPRERARLDDDWFLAEASYAAGAEAHPWGVGPLGGAQAKYTAFLERLSPEVLKEERARVRVAAVPLESPAAAPPEAPTEVSGAPAPAPDLLDGGILAGLAGEASQKDPSELSAGARVRVAHAARLDGEAIPELWQCGDLLGERWTDVAARAGAARHVTRSATVLGRDEGTGRAWLRFDNGEGGLASYGLAAVGPGVAPAAVAQYAPGARLLLVAGRERVSDAVVLESLAGTRHRVVADGKCVDVDLSDANHCLASMSAEAFEEAAAAHRADIARDYGRLEDAITGKHLHIEEQLVAVETKASRGVSRSDLSGVSSMKALALELRRADAAGLARGERDVQPVVLCANMGTGKTFGACMLAYWLARGAAGDGSYAPVPLLVFIHHLSRQMRNGVIEDSEELVLAYVRARFAANPRKVAMLEHARRAASGTRATPARPPRRWRLRRIILVLDGVDEAAGLKSTIADYVLNHLIPNGVRVVVTSRPEGVDVSRWARVAVVLDLAPLSESQQLEAIRHQLEGDEYFERLHAFSEIRRGHDKLYDAQFSRDQRTRMATLAAPDITVRGVERGKAVAYAPELRCHHVDGRRLIEASAARPVASKLLAALDARLDSATLAACDFVALKGAKDARAAAEAVEASTGGDWSRGARSELKQLLALAARDGVAPSVLWRRIVDRTAELYETNEVGFPLFQKAITELARAAAKRCGRTATPVLEIVASSVDHARRAPRGHAGAP